MLLKSMEESSSPFACANLKETAFLVFDFSEGEDTCLIVVGQTCLHVFYGVYEEEIIQGVDVFFGSEDDAFFLVVAGMVDGYEGEGECPS